MIEITSVNVIKLDEKENGRLRGIASIVINESFVVNDIKIVEGDNGLFIGMPNKRTNTGRFKDVAHPINQEARDIIQKAILSKYEEE